MSKRLQILKTYKMFSNGSFIRSESGRYYPVEDGKGQHFANVCRGTRKDVRNSVVDARKAVGAWSKRTAYNRGQILYRLAEMLDARFQEWVELLTTLGLKPNQAQKDVQAAIDRCVYFAGWSDKYQQVFGTVNPVSSPHFNFSMPEATGLIGIVGTQNVSLLGLISQVVPSIVGGNTVVHVAQGKAGVVSSVFGEFLHTSDVPAGVVNVLTGYFTELLPTLSQHMDVNAMHYLDELSPEEERSIQEAATLNIKRLSRVVVDAWSDQNWSSPYRILDFQEIKTTWHPAGF